MVGTRRPEDPANLIGDHGHGERNDRGRQLTDWATATNLLILKTAFRKPADKQWTHIKKGLQRLIDYYLCENSDAP